MDYHKIVPDTECSANIVRVKETYLFLIQWHTVYRFAVEHVPVFFMLFHVSGVVALYLLPVGVLFTGLDKPYLKFMVCSDS